MPALNFLDGKTVLVTGATGFIGQHLVSRLRQIQGIDLVLLSRKGGPASLSNEKWVWCTLEDLTPQVWRENGIENIDIVFHLGAFIPKSADQANQEEPVFRANIWGTRILLHSLTPSPEQFVFASTIDVYAPSAGQVIDENANVGASSLYGASKLFCEQLIRVYAQMHGFSCAILRYGHIFGPGEEAYSKLIPVLIRRLLQGESPVLHGDGSAQRDFLYVEDAVEATIRAALSERAELGPLNIVRGQSVTIRNIAEKLVTLTGFEGDIHYQPDRPVGDSLRFDNRRMKEFLGAWEFISLQEGLRREVEYFRDEQR